jgi:hypothetical protein
VKRKLVIFEISCIVKFLCMNEIILHERVKRSAEFFERNLEIRIFYLRSNDNKHALESRIFNPRGVN